MRTLLTVFIAFLLSNACLADDDLFYVGTWKSNAELTLASMNAVKDIPEKDRKNYENDFYGHLVNVIRKDSFTTYFDNQKPEKLNFINADIKIIDKNTIRMVYYHERFKQNIVKEISFENGCYYVVGTVWQFKEYFCRID
ncbi:hypothetical protein P886_2424 [Alteromonadaceae bacterium 2753L.S.0a.02]|nr:hypothetical protein P886_2424 [Alteromonadaceae bacterium 2753L.S.0a.02]